MPILIQCPDCARQLWVPDSRAGTKGKCPKCGGVLNIPAAEEEEAEEETETAVRTRPAVKPRPASEDQDDNRPRRSKPFIRKDDDEQEEEDGDDQPRRKKKGLKGKKKKGGGNTKLLLILGGVAVLLLLLSGGGLAWWLLSTPAYPGDERFYPDNTTVIANINFETILNSEVVKRLSKEIPQFQSKVLADSPGDVVKTAEISHEIIASDTKNNHVFIIYLKVPISASERAKEGGFQSSRVGSYALYENAAKQEAFIAPQKNIVVTGFPASLRSILERKGNPVISDSLRNALQRAGTSSPVLLGVVTSQLNIPKAPPGGGGRPGGFGGMANVDVMAQLKEIDAFALAVDLGTADVKLTATAICKSPAVAEEARKKMQQQLNDVKNNPLLGVFLGPLKPILDSIQMLASGSDVIVRVTLTTDTMLQLAKQFGGQANPAGGPANIRPAR